MRRFRLVILSILALAMAIPAFATEPGVVTDGAWSRVTVGTTRPGVMYLDISNTGDKPVTLTGFKTDVSKSAMIHKTETDAQGVATMKPAGDIEIAPGATISLKPGGLHGMLMGLKKPLAEGDSFDATLTFKDGGTLDVTVPVLGMTAIGPDN